MPSYNMMCVLHEEANWPPLARTAILWDVTPAHPKAWLLTSRMSWRKLRVLPARQAASAINDGAVAFGLPCKGATFFSMQLPCRRSHMAGTPAGMIPWKAPPPSAPPSPRPSPSRSLGSGSRPARRRPPPRPPPGPPSSSSCPLCASPIRSSASGLVRGM